MYKINTSVDKPDIAYMKEEIERLMERGLRLGNLDEIEKYYIAARDSLTQEIKDKYGIENPNSPKQIKEYLEKLSAEIPLTEKNDVIEVCYNNGKWTTNKEAMLTLSEMGYSIGRDIIDYRHVKKYAESVASVKKYADKDGLIHPRVTLGKTNRINYSDPGIMTIPKKLLWHIIAPYNEDATLYSIDIKNQEPSILINIVNEDVLKYALESEEGLYETMFKEVLKPQVTLTVLIDTLKENRIYSIEELKRLPQVDPVSYLPVRPNCNSIYYNDERVVAIESVCQGGEYGVEPIYPKTVTIETETGTAYELEVEWEKVKSNKRKNDYTLKGDIKGCEIRINKSERNEFKVAWLAMTYGASAYGIEKMCKRINGKTVYDYISNLENMKKYRSMCNKLARNGQQYIKTIFGTVLHADETEPNKLKRILLDLPIQGTGADVLSLLIKHFNQEVVDRGLEGSLSLYYTRHDELIVEVSNSWIREMGIEEVEKTLRDIMEHQINDWTPFKVEIEQVEKGDLGIEIEDD